MKRALSALCLVLLSSTCSWAQFVGVLYPENLEVEIPKGHSVQIGYDFSVEIPSTDAGELDILLLIDSTGSMADYIADTAQAFGGIFDAVSLALPDTDVLWALADYRDYTDQGDYQLYGATVQEPFTNDPALIQQGLDRLRALGGGDLLEAQLKALVNLASNWTGHIGDTALGGRAGARKLIIWGGDEAGHTAGDEPGANGPPPPGYYPSLDQTVAALAAEGIVVVALNASHPWAGINHYYDGQPQAAYITQATGGTIYHQVGSGGPGIEAAVVDYIRSGISNLTNVTLSLKSGPGAFAIAPSTHTITGEWTLDDPPLEGAHYLTATAPDFEAGQTLTLTLLANGAEAATSRLLLYTPGASPCPPVAADVRITPQALNFPSRGQFVTCSISVVGQTIVAPSVVLGGALYPVAMETTGNGGLLVKFDRADVVEYLLARGLTGRAELTVTGQLESGASFTGTDLVELLH